MSRQATVYTAAEAIDDPRYREMLLRLIQRQLMAEYRAMLVYTKAVELAPTWDTKAFIARIGAEEGDHTVLLARLAQDFGIDPDAYLQAYFAKHPIEYHTSWLEVMARLFLGDRAAVYQLTSYKNNSYRPWAEALESIIDDEAGDGGHMERGEALVTAICSEPESKAEFQRILNYMLPYGIKLLGDPANSAENDYCLAVGLKTRTSAQVQESYLEVLLRAMDRVGLRVPDLSMVHLTPRSQALVARHAS